MLREIGRVTLVEPLQLTALIAVKDPRRHVRVSAPIYVEKNAGTVVGMVDVS